MLRINFPIVSYAEQEISLGGFKYTFIYKYNDWDERWRIDIHKGSEVVVSGLKVLENSSLIKRNFSLPGFDHGDIICVRLQDDASPAGRDNIGLHKAYELIYLSNEELDAV